MIKTEALTVHRLRGTTVFKLVLIGNTIGIAVLFFIMGFFVLTGFEIIRWNGEYLRGIKGFILSPIIGVIISSGLGLFTAVFTYLGLRLFAKFKPLTIEYIPTDDSVN